MEERAIITGKELSPQLEVSQKKAAVMTAGPTSGRAETRGAVAGLAVAGMGDNVE